MLSQAAVFVKTPGLVLPEAFDAAENWPQCAKVITDIRDQSMCGCCWAFGAVPSSPKPPAVVRAPPQCHGHARSHTVVATSHHTHDATRQAEAASDRLCIGTNGSIVLPLSAEDMCFCASSDGCDGGDLFTCVCAPRLHPALHSTPAP